MSAGTYGIRPWADDEVVGVLTAEIIYSVAKIGTPGFDSVRKLVCNYERVRASYMDAARERLRTLPRKRAALRREAERIARTPIDWKATAAAMRTAAHPDRSAGASQPLRPKGA